MVSEDYGMEKERSQSARERARLLIFIWDPKEHLESVKFVRYGLLGTFFLRLELVGEKPVLLTF